MRWVRGLRLPCCLLDCVLTLLFPRTQVSFMETKINGLFFLNRFIDLAFLGDMSLQFLLPFKPTSVNSVRMQHFWVVSHYRIAKKYLLG
jgi:hypothetical protein